MIGAEFWQSAWVWVSAGIVLAIIETLIPGFIFLGFAAGAVIVGILVAFGFAPTGLPALVFMFAVISLVSWLIMRKLAGERKGQIKIWDRDINE